MFLRQFSKMRGEVVHFHSRPKFNFTVCYRNTSSILRWEFGFMPTNDFSFCNVCISFSRCFWQISNTWNVTTIIAKLHRIWAQPTWYSKMYFFKNILTRLRSDAYNQSSEKASKLRGRLIRLIKILLGVFSKYKFTDNCCTATVVAGSKKICHCSKKRAQSTGWFCNPRINNSIFDSWKPTPAREKGVAIRKIKLIHRNGYLWKSILWKTVRRGLNLNPEALKGWFLKS